MENVRLYRSLDNRMVAGVCGGLGSYLNVDATFIRLLFVLLLFGSDFGFILYLILWILIPEEGKAYGFKEETIGDRVKSMGDDIQQAVREPHPQAGVILGIGLIAIGGFLFLDQMNFTWMRWLEFDILWPVLLVVGGFVLLFRKKQE